MKAETSTRKPRKVLAVELGPELAEAIASECSERTTIAHKCTASEVVRDALFVRYFGDRKDV